MGAGTKTTVLVTTATVVVLEQAISFGLAGLQSLARPMGHVLCHLPVKPILNNEQIRQATAA